MIFSPLNIIICALILSVGGFLLGFWDYSAISGNLGSSPFLQITGIMVVAMGCEFTPFGKRLAYWFLKYLGHNPTWLVVVFGVVTAMLSSFVSNIAVIVMMSSIAAGLLGAMKQVPGKSNLGRSLMLVVSMGSMVGGMALFSGSPVGNGMAIQFLEQSTGYTVSYAEWALFGVPCFLVAIVPMCLIYVKTCKLKNSDVEVLPREYYEGLLKELGPMGGSEIRWIIIVVAMVALMIKGYPGALVALGCAGVALLPVVGTVPVDKVWSRLPFGLLLAMAMLPIMAKIIRDTGVVDMVNSMVIPLVQDMSPLTFSIVAAMLMGLLVNLFIGASAAATAALMTIISPICYGLGYNPVVIMMPSMFAASFFFAMGANTYMLMNKSYGFWEIKDPMLPGYICVILTSILFPIICYIIGPLAGLPIRIS
jgi:sodium-dependent dicarboxylate transporter 2/3/5